MPLPPQGYKPSQKNTTGGFQTATIYSGVGVSLLPATIPSAPLVVTNGSDALLFSGAGRLDNVLVFTSLTNGQIFTFYDAAVAASGGPLLASGHKVLGNVPANIISVSTASGNYGFSYPNPVQFSMPFQSGLCVHTVSGQGGFTASWSPEVANQ